MGRTTTVHFVADIPDQETSPRPEPCLKLAPFQLVYNYTMISAVQQHSLAITVLSVYDSEKDNLDNLETLYNFTEIIKTHSSKENAIIYDLSEYIYESIRKLRGEEGAFIDESLRSGIIQTPSLKSKSNNKIL